MTYIVDACVAVKWVVQEINYERARVLLKNRENEPLLAPDLLLPECINALQKKVKNNEFDIEDIKRVLPVFTKGISRFIPLVDMFEQAVDLSTSLPHSIYDCIYLTCAVKMQCKLITADMEFINQISSTKYKQFVVPLCDISS